MSIFTVVIISSIVLSLIVRLLVEALNISALKKEVPDEFIGVYDNERYAKAQGYLKDNTKFTVFNTVFMGVITVLALMFGFFEKIDIMARGFALNPILTGLIFFGIIFLISELLSLPFSLYKVFVLEEKYGFNKMNARTFIGDFIKSFILQTVLGAILLFGVLYIFQKFGFSGWILCWVFMLIFEVLLIYIWPALIMPLFNKFIPLEEGELKNAVLNFAKSENFKMQGIYKMDGSRRSAKTNAFFTGFGRFRKIALFDTLIAKHTTTEIVSILAHEIGHYKKRHIIKQFALSLIFSAIGLFLAGYFATNENFSYALNVKTYSIYAGLFAFMILYPVINLFFSAISNYFSRKHEYEADAFAASSVGNSSDMLNALKKLSVDNLSNLTPHSVKVLFDYTHPPVLMRIQALIDRK
ncbi:MAG: M48 family metallopeptidase [Endomicrobiales bacterium]|nr:M48 family metallopeptidase [Endomicrobiales bacterium]